MDIAVSQGMEGFKILHLINLKTNIRIGKDRCTVGTAQIDYLIIILFHPVKFDPCNMVFHCVGVVNLMPYNHSNDVPSRLMPPVNFNMRDMFLVSFILLCFDDFKKIHIILLSLTLKRLTIIFYYSQKVIFSRYKRGSIWPGPPHSGM